MKCVYAFPYISSKNGGYFDTEDIYNSIRIHRALLLKLGSSKNFIPELCYTNKYIDMNMMENIQNYKDFFNGERIVDILSIYDNKSIKQENLIKKSLEIEVLLNDLYKIDSKLVDKSKINEILYKNSLVRNYKEEKIDSKNKFKVLKVDGEDASLEYEWMEKISKTDQWIIDIIELFKDITKSGFIIDTNKFLDTYGENSNNIHPLDYFIFTEDAKLKYFIGFNSVFFNYKFFNKKSKDIHILENNLRAFANLIKSVFSFYYTNFRDYNFPHKSGVMKIYEKFNNNATGFIDFDEALNIIKSDRTRNIESKIGVFVDTANIYVGMRSLDIDFDHLITSVYGIEALKQIKYKIATIVYPKYKSRLKTKYVRSLQDKLKESLERYGFDVKAIMLDGPKANQVDDNLLINLIENRIDSIDKILLMTGDKHFYDVLCKYRDKKKDIKIISVSEEDTSSCIFDGEFKNNHFYIHEYWDSVILYRK